MLFETDGLAFSVDSQKTGKVVTVKDMRNNYVAELALNAAGIFYIIKSPFPRGGKRYFEMLYAAEIYKGQLV